MIESVFFGYKRRKAQFEYRLKRLHEQVTIAQIPMHVATEYWPLRGSACRCFYY